MEVNCLICYNAFLFFPKTADECKLSDCLDNIDDPNRLFRVFCKYMKVEANYQWLDQPFCNQCLGAVMSLCQLDCEIEALENKAGKIAAGCAASILKSFSRTLASPSDPMDRNRPLHDIRKQIYNQYNPQVELIDSLDMLGTTDGSFIPTKHESCQSNEMLPDDNVQILLNPLLADSNSQSNSGIIPEIKWEVGSVAEHDIPGVDPLEDLTGSPDNLFLNEYLDCSGIISMCEDDDDEVESSTSVSVTPEDRPGTRKKKDYNCTKCGPEKAKKFNSRQALKAHMERSHGGGIDCTKCNAHLSCKSTYYRHLRVVHDKSTKMIGKSRKTVSVNRKSGVVISTEKSGKTSEAFVRPRELPTGKHYPATNQEVKELKIPPMRELKVQLNSSDVYRDPFPIVSINSPMSF